MKLLAYLATVYKKPQTNRQAAEQRDRQSMHRPEPTPDPAKASALIICIEARNQFVYFTHTDSTNVGEVEIMGGGERRKHVS